MEVCTLGIGVGQPNIPGGSDAEGAGVGGIPVFVRLAEAYRKEALLEDAIRVCREGLKAWPDCVAARLVLGRALGDRRDRAEAREEFRRILSLDATNAEAQRALEALEAGPGPAADPLSSPTLAALLACQGHSAASDAVYGWLAAGDASGRSAAAPVDASDPVLDALRALREGARRLRAIRLSQA